MITFNRSQIVGAEFIDSDTVRFNGIQEDHIYGMEITMEVQIASGVIQKINGKMKRVTNFVCPEAVRMLNTAVGMSLQEEGWEKTIMKEIGRKGCEHLAEIIIECGRSLNPALMSRDLNSALKEDPDLDQTMFLNSWPGYKRDEK